MDNLFKDYKIEEFKLKKPRKNEEKLRLRKRLEELLGRNPRSVWATTMIWTEEMLKDSIRACENFSDIKARNFHFNEYVKSTRVK